MSIVKIKNRQLSIINTMQSTGEKIKEFVEKNVPNKDEYKDKLGMSYNGMFKYFKDERKPGFYVLKRLHALGMNIHNLLETSDAEN